MTLKISFLKLFHPYFGHFFKSVLIWSSKNAFFKEFKNKIFVTRESLITYKCNTFNSPKYGLNECLFAMISIARHSIFLNVPESSLLMLYYKINSTMSHMRLFLWISLTYTTISLKTTSDTSHALSISC